MIWIPVGIIILGFLPLSLVWLKFWLTKKSIARATETTGIVEQIEKKIGNKGNRYFVATINYAVGYERLRVNHVLGYGSRNKLVPGQQLAILYNPKKPLKIHLKEYPYNFRIAWIVTGIMAIAYIVLAYFLYKEFKL